MAIQLYDNAARDPYYAAPEIRDLSDKEQNEQVILSKQKHRKISTENGKAQLYVSDSRVCISNEENGIAVDDNGLVISGKYHMVANVSDMRLSGFYTLNPLLLTLLPSTNATPIPTLVFSTPQYAQLLSKLESVLASI